MHCYDVIGKLISIFSFLVFVLSQIHNQSCDVQEEDKAKLVQETGLQLKQINNWFINQRKRNWHSNASTSTVSKSKRKRYNYFLKIETL